MIQRIQTILLLLVAILCVVYIFIPVFKVSEGENSILSKITDIKLFINKSYLLIGTIWISLIGFLTIVTIFLFKKRALQIKFCWLNSIVSAGLQAFLIYRFFEAKSIDDTSTFLMPGFFFPILFLVLLVVSQNKIRKDEKLVRSLDRLR